MSFVIPSMYGFTVPTSSTPSFTGLLDSLVNTPLVAYSLRLLTGSYSSYCCRIRRSSDNVVVDVNFYNDGTNRIFSLESTISLVSGDSSATNVGEFVAAAGYTNVDNLGAADSAFIVTWYDQIGFADLKQSTAGSQPRIINTGVIEIKNGKPSIFFDNTVEKFIQTDTFTARTPANTSVYTVHSLEGYSGSYGWIYQAGGSKVVRDAWNAKWRAFNDDGEYAAAPATALGAYGYLFRLTHYLNTDDYCWFNVHGPTRSESRYSDSSSSISFSLNKMWSEASKAKHNISEQIIFETGLMGSADETGLWSDINSYYGITT